MVWQWLFKYDVISPIITLEFDLCLHFSVDGLFVLLH